MTFTMEELRKLVVKELTARDDAAMEELMASDVYQRMSPQDVLALNIVRMQEQLNMIAIMLELNKSCSDLSARAFN